MPQKSMNYIRQVSHQHETKIRTTQKVRELVPGMLILAAGRAKDVEGQLKEQFTLLEAWWDRSMGKEQKICNVAKQLLPENAS